MLFWSGSDGQDVRTIEVLDDVDDWFNHCVQSQDCNNSVAGSCSPSLLALSGDPCLTSFPSKQESKIIEITPKKLEELQKRKVNGFGLEDGCPIGTVPISRTSPNSHWGEDPPPPEAKLVHCVAGVQTSEDSSRNFLGVSGTLLVFKPTVYDDGQYSSARIKLINGKDSVEAGYLVSPKLFNDSEAHLYVSFEVGGSKLGCVNLQCFGFVQVDKDVALGYPPTHYSVIGGQLWSWDLSIQKDIIDQNWWVYISSAPIGYWPNEIFDSLVDFANQVEWGGEVYDFGLKNPPSSLPDMGSGMKGSYQKSAAAIYHATYLDDNYVNRTNPDRTNTIANCDPDYVVLDNGYINDEFGRVIHFGGAHDEN
uniref:Neprosin PEP catalytic domain-containing protein n=1 Tax=Chenopodium quinoa TaxID=63459 RepID=A0A803LHN8_CHEQI